MSASANGYTDIAEELIDHGADIDAQQAGGWTPLMIAIRAGQVDIVRLLLQHKAKIFDSKEQIRPGQSAAQLKSTPDSALPLIGAVLGGHTEILSLLLQHGANPNIRNSRGQTALMIAAANGSHADIKVLRKVHAVVPVLDDFGYTVLRMGWVQVKGMIGAGNGDHKAVDTPVSGRLKAQSKKE